MTEKPPESNPPEDIPRILFADDDLGLCRVIEAGMDCQPCRLTIVHTGKDALFEYQAAITAKDPYDLIVLDVAMPTASGLSAAEDIRTLGDWETPIVFFTADNSDMTVARERMVKPVAVWRKPLGIVNLCEQVHDLLAKIKLAA